MNFPLLGFLEVENEFSVGISRQSSEAVLSK